ncbi:hypothetical protein L7F22_048662 [Adiantum nelumboides]|nr:hypothetical protein [Adiantum nelumboides]
MWDELLKLYGATEKHSKIALKLNFFCLEMKPGDHLSTFIFDMKSIMTQLASIDAKVNPDDAIAVLLKSMPLEFDALVTTLTHLPDPTWESCEADLLEDQKIRRRNGGSATTSTLTNDQALYANKDVEEDERAQAIIALNLGKGFIHHVAIKATAKDMWDELLKLYGATGKHSKIALKMKFFCLEMKPDDNLSTFISDMKSIMTQLAFIDAKVNPDDAIAILLKSMPLEFDALVTTLTHLPDPTWESCEAALLEDEKIRRWNGGSATTSTLTNEQALYANKDTLKMDASLRKRPTRDVSHLVSFSTLIE